MAARTADIGLVQQARDAFTTAMSTSFIAAACSVLGGVALAVLLLRDPGPGPAPAGQAPEIIAAGTAELSH